VLSLRVHGSHRHHRRIIIAQGYRGGGGDTVADIGGRGADGGDDVFRWLDGAVVEGNDIYDHRALAGGNGHRGRNGSVVAASGRTAAPSNGEIESGGRRSDAAKGEAAAVGRSLERIGIARRDGNLGQAGVVIPERHHDRIRGVRKVVAVRGELERDRLGAFLGSVVGRGDCHRERGGARRDREGPVGTVGHVIGAEGVVGIAGRGTTDR
jgi:hypothetical protein